MLKNNTKSLDRRGLRGLTLIELLVTIAVIAVVAAIAVPTISNVISTSRSNAVNVMQEEVNSFIEKYSASGKIGWDKDTRTFTAWIDTNGDGLFTETDPREIIETLTVGTEFDVEIETDADSKITGVEVEKSGGSKSVAFVAGFAGGGENITQVIKSNSTDPLTSNSFNRPNYSFSGWNTNSDGSGDNYTDGESLALDDDLVLYAQWSGNTYSLTYDYDDATGGNTVAGADYITGETEITLVTPLKTGYTLVGWNNSEAGEGTDYDAGSNISLTSDTILYAQWNANNYSLTYAYGSATGNNTLDSSNYTTDGTEIVLPEPTRSGGYTFIGWNTTQDGTGTLYEAGGKVSLSENDTYYARWSITGDSTSKTFNYTGSSQYYDVPANAIDVSFIISGGAGSSGSGSDGPNNIGNKQGGLGGRVTGEFITTPEEFTVFVGGGGGNGYWNGGGYSAAGSRGGGGTDIRIGGTTLDDRVAVAGGGGGGGEGNSTFPYYAGNTTAGGAGGNTQAEASGSGQYSYGGQGGVPNSGGSRNWAGDAGSKGQGGSGGWQNGGGGGGGWYGGSGGEGKFYGTGGGGGSSYADSSLITSVNHSSGVQSGNGRVVISYSTVTESH